ncbi:MAG: hypothetical protein H6510_11325 [Acidobacteria bacterium]|nr:hypothetical protein [Acidobacteriota bacterium]MCB9398396.1 hypothetical protein [Acidobacteriota bacterium]
MDPVSEKQLRRQLTFKKGGETTFAILEAENGGYVQMLGGGVACCLEWRMSLSGPHFRACQFPPKVAWNEPSKLGSIDMQPEEFFFIGQVIEVFVAFLNHKPFPDYITWKDITQELQSHLGNSPGRA